MRLGDGSQSLTIYAKRALRDRKIPFEITAPINPFFSESNQKQLKKAAAQMDAGQIVVKTFDDLERLEEE